MKRAAATVLLALAALPAHAWTRVGIGINIGVPLYWPPPYYYVPPPVYYPAPVIVQSPPAVYAQPAPPPGEAWWYYCPDSRTYYPYVQSCAAGWQRVSPVPEDQRPPR